MSNQFLKLRRSAVPGRVPSTSSIDFGEIALNTFDGLAFIKRSGSNGEEVITLGSREGAFTGSFSGSFVGNGAGLFNVPASGIVGLNLSQIATGSVSASVGIGASSFSVVSGSSTFLYVSSSGNVGIGTSTPSQKLHITNGDILIERSDSFAGFIVRSTRLTGGEGSAQFFLQSQVGDTNLRFLAYGDASNPAAAGTYVQSGNYARTANMPLFFSGYNGNIGSDLTFKFTKTMFTDGNVGIGTTSPSFILDIAGNTNSLFRQHIKNSSSGSLAQTAILLRNDADMQYMFGITSTGYTTALGLQFGDAYVQHNDILGSYPSSALVLRTSNLNAIKFQTNATERMRLFGSTGNLLLQNGGTFTDSGERLQVSGSSRFVGNMTVTGSSYFLGPSDNVAFTIRSGTASSAYLLADIQMSSGASALTIANNGAINAYSSITYGGQTIVNNEGIIFRNATPVEIGRIAQTTNETGGATNGYTSNQSRKFTFSHGIYSSGGNTILGPLSADSGERLQVSGSSRFVGDMVITGSSLRPLVINGTNSSVRLAINQTGGSTNTGIGLLANNVSKWSLAHYIPTGTNTSFVFYNDQTGINSLFINGDTDNVGIGTITPTARLDVSGSGRFGGNLVITGSGNTSGTNALSIVNSSNSSLLFVRNDGNVGIGTNAPLNTLHINGTARVNYIIMPEAFGSFGSGGGITIYADYIYREAYSTTIARTLSLKGNAGINFVSNNTGQTAFLWQEDYATSTLYMTYGNDRSVTVGSNLTHTSSIFTIDSRTKGFLTPRMTAAQRLAITTPAQGLIVYDTGSATEGLWLYNSGSTPGWQQVLTNSGSQSISGSITVNSITVTGTLTAQTIVAQTITSSTDYVSGSTIFGNSLSNTHQFTGSVSITGSLSLPYLSTGSVLFVGSGGSISQNNSNFFWDNGNARLGIGTNAPAHALHVVNASSVRFERGGTINFDISNTTGLTNFLRLSAANGSVSVGTIQSIPLYFTMNSFPAATLSANSNFIVGSTSDSGERLQVSGSSRFMSDMTITGSGATSATNALTIVNSSSANMLRMLNDTTLKIGSQNIDIFPTANGSTVSNAGRGLVISTNASSQTDVGALKIVGGYSSALGSDYGLWISHIFTNGTGGTAIHNGLLLNQTINQTGGANGTTRGLYVNPTLTAAANFRAVEWSNNASGSAIWGLYGAGTAPNYLAGGLGIGTTSVSAGLTVWNSDIFIKSDRFIGAGNTEASYGSVWNRIQLYNGSNGDMSITLHSTAWWLRHNANMSIAGNTLIGLTSSSGERLQVSGSSRFVGDMVITGSATLRNASGTGSISLSPSSDSILTLSGFYSSGQTNIQLTSGGSDSYINAFGASNRLIIRNNSGITFTAYSSATQYMHVNSSGLIIGGTSTTPTARLDVRGNTFISGTLDILDAEINYQRNNNVTTGSARLIASIPTASLNAAFFDYVIVSGSNARAGTVTSVWASSSVEWNETYTNDIGSTTDVSLYAAITGSSIGLFATSSINNIWTIKSLIRTI